jgi:hypothetical protein
LISPHPPSAIEAVERGSLSADEFLSSAGAGVRSYFRNDDSAAFKFAGSIVFLRKE